MSLSQKIKNYALSLGYDYVGIIDAEGFPEHLENLQERYGMYQFGIEGPLRLMQAADTKMQMPTAKSIIVVAMDYYKEAMPEELSKILGRYYISRAQPSSAYSPINQHRRKLMREFLEFCGCTVGDKVAVPERQAAVRAGIGNYGKNGFVYGQNSGSYLILSSFVVDLELDYDKPVYEEICPENCSICMKSCPTGAIYEPYKMNPCKCITLINLTGTGNLPGIPQVVPHDLRDKIGVHIHGCDICQDVCPLNKIKHSSKLPFNAYLESLVPDFQLSRIVNMDEETYQTRIRPLVYNYFNKRQLLQRNAAIALGNLDDPSTVPDLELSIHNEEEIVRAYSAWALGRIGGKVPSDEIYASAANYIDWNEEKVLRDQAEPILQRALSEESSEWVIAEIREALNYIQDNKFYNRVNRLVL